MWHIDIGSILGVGLEKVLLMQNALDLRDVRGHRHLRLRGGLASEVPQFSSAAAIGLFGSVVGPVLLIMANSNARRLAKSSLW